MDPLARHIDAIAGIGAVAWAILVLLVPHLATLGEHVSPGAALAFAVLAFGRWYVLAKRGPGGGTLGALVLLASLATSGCATLGSLAEKAERVRRESAALMMALTETLDACEELQEPKPRVCSEADDLAEALEPYVDMRKPAQP